MLLLWGTSTSKLPKPRPLLMLLLWGTSTSKLPKPRPLLLLLLWGTPTSKLPNPRPLPKHLADRCAPLCEVFGLRHMLSFGSMRRPVWRLLMALGTCPFAFVQHLLLWGCNETLFSL
ncbi:hypothetical protein DFJ77DRAFT_471832 [Powellomyces hirtus]|nr:hypothetical protein DFJ77DRAFT_471832 [Powellomyces hirtus]